MLVKHGLADSRRSLGVVLLKRGELLEGADPTKAAVLYEESAGLLTATLGPDEMFTKLAQEGAARTREALAGSRSATTGKGKGKGKGGRKK